MPEMNTADMQKIEKLFAGPVFRMLLKEGMISEELVENMRFWKHSGFSVHCGKPTKACDADGRKTLSEYISRALFSLERMSYNEDSDERFSGQRELWVVPGAAHGGANAPEYINYPEFFVRVCAFFEREFE